MQLRVDGLWNDHLTGLPPQTNGAPVQAYVIEWNIASASPIPNVRIPDPVLPVNLPGSPGGELLFSAMVVDAGINSANIVGAVDRVMSGSGTVLTGMVSEINFVDPEGPSAGVFPPDQPYLGNTTNLDAQLVHRYRGRIVIPTNGVYTFGLNTDDASALRIRGQAWASVSGSGMLDTFSPDTIIMERGLNSSLGVIDLNAGEYELDLVVYQDSGISGHELFSAMGAFSDVLGTHTWRLIGHQPALTPLPIPTIDPVDQWVVATSAPGSNAVINTLNSLADIAIEFANDPSIVTSNWARIDFVDPQGTGGGDHFPNNHPFDNGTGGPDDDFAVRATGLLNIPEDGIYLFGFKSDDGSSLEIDGQAFSNIIFAVNGNSVINSVRDCPTTPIPASQRHRAQISCRQPVLRVNAESHWLRGRHTARNARHHRAPRTGR